MSWVKQVESQRPVTREVVCPRMGGVIKVETRSKEREEKLEEPRERGREREV